MSVKMNLRIITKNHAANPGIGFLTKSISKPNGRSTAMPTAWELNKTYTICAEKYQKMRLRSVENFINYWQVSDRCEK